MKRRDLVYIATLVFGLAACKTGDDTDVADETGETGDTGDGDGDSTEASCGEQTETVLDDLFVTPPGFETALNERLAAVEGNFEGTYTWFPAEGPWTSTHAGTESPLVAAMAYSGGAIRLVEVERVGQLPTGEGDGSLCSNYVVIDVILEFATDDGVFAESLVVPLTIRGAEDELLAANIYHSLDLDQTMGTLGPADFVAMDGTVTDVVLLGYFDTAGLTGGLAVEVMSGEGPDGVVGFGNIAQFVAGRI